MENGVFLTAFLFQEAWSLMMVSDPDLTGHVISDPDQNPDGWKVSDPSSKRKKYRTVHSWVIFWGLFVKILTQFLQGSRAGSSKLWMRFIPNWFSPDLGWIIYSLGHVKITNLLVTTYTAWMLLQMSSESLSYFKWVTYLGYLTRNPS